VTNIQPSLNKTYPPPLHPGVMAQLEIFWSALVGLTLVGFWGQLPSAQDV